METLTVYKSQYQKKRFGSIRYGSYVLADLPNNYDYLITAGSICNDINFELDILDKNPNLHCIIFDVTTNYSPDFPRLTLKKLNLSKHNSEISTNLINEIQPYNNILLKMDIEGHEYEIISNIIETGNIHKIKQLIIEIHTPSAINKEPHYFFNLSYVTNTFMFEMLKKLNQTHTLIHFHSNNACGYHINQNTILPDIFKCTYVRNDFNPEKILNNIPFPTLLDKPNVQDRPQYYIDYQPFCHLNYNKQEEFFKTLSDMDEILTKNNQKYFLTDGTLLGAIRENKFIEHDTDIDIGIFINDYNIDIEKEILKKFRLNNRLGNLKDGYEISFVHPETYVTIDIFIFYIENDFTWTNTFFITLERECRIKYKYNFKDTIQIKFNNKIFNVPNPPEEYLEKKYGSEWRIPKKIEYLDGINGEYKNIYTE